jgi:nucleoside-diphosphate-sugar epimerase
VRELLARGYRVRAVVRPGKDLDGDDVAHLRALPGAAERLTVVEADLDEAQYVRAFQDCEGVVHLATPYIYTAPDPQRDIVAPAVAGATGALRAARHVGTVRRFVYTSSGGAVFHFPVPPGYLFSEDDWNTQSSLTKNPYFFSKKCAEEAVWSLARAGPGGVAGAPQASAPAVVVCNPLFVVGPTLTPKLNSSLTTSKKMLMGEVPAPQAGFIGLVDVRDVALAHVLALEHPAAPGRRLFLCSEVTEWKTIALALKAALPQYPNVPNLTDDVAPAPFGIDTAPVRALGFAGFRPVRASVADTGHSLIAHGLVPAL